MTVSLIFCVVASVAATGQSVTTVPDPTAAGGSESLGNQLLDDLPVAAPQEKPYPHGEDNSLRKKTPPPAQSQADETGEDIGALSGPLLLGRVRNDMRRAETLLGRPVTATNTDSLQQAGVVQERVVAQLDELIAELSIQCQGGQCQPNNNPSPQPSQSAPAKPNKPSRTASLSKSPARDSSDPLDRANGKPVEKGDVDELVKHLWGHLPQRSREQVLQSFSDEFLPKYEAEIEQYYRKLSEEQGDRNQ
jgi:hypothetical protein